MASEKDWLLVEDDLGQPTEPVAPAPLSHSSDISETDAHMLAASVFPPIEITPVATDAEDATPTAAPPSSRGRSPASRSNKQSAAGSSGRTTPRRQASRSRGRSAAREPKTTPQAPPPQPPAPATSHSHPSDTPSVPNFAFLALALAGLCFMLTRLRDDASGLNRQLAARGATDLTAPPGAGPRQRRLPGRGPAVSITDGAEPEDWESRFQRLELEALGAIKRLTAHDTRLTALETRVDEIAAILESHTACGAVFPKPPGSGAPAVTAEGRGGAIEARTQVLPRHGKGELVQGAFKCPPGDRGTTAGEEASCVGGNNPLVETPGPKCAGEVLSGVEAQVAALAGRLAALEAGVVSLREAAAAQDDTVASELANLASGMASLHLRVEGLVKNIEEGAAAEVRRAGAQVAAAAAAA